MRKIYTSIDLGTDSVKVLTIEYFNHKYNVLASSCVHTKGLKQGLIIDAASVGKSILKAIKNIENKLGTKVNKLLAIVPSHNINFEIVTGNTKIESEDKKITGEVIFSCLQNAIKENIKQGIEIVTVIPVEYRVDKQTKVKNPIGMIGETILVKAVVGSVPKKNVYSVVGLLENLGLEVVDICFSSIADYYAIKSNELDNKVVALANIGSEITKIAIFNKSVMIKEKILIMGGKSIDSDITFSFKTELNESRKIKENFAVSNRKYADNDDSYSCTNRLEEKIEINQYTLAEIVEGRVVDILKNIKKEINILTNREIGYIIITGGITSMTGFNALVEKIFIKNAGVMNIGVIGIRNNKYSSAYGMIKYFVEKLETRDKEYTMFSENNIEEMLAIRKKKGATGVLGKIFGKIFD